MNKTSLNIGIKNNAGIRVKPSVIVGNSGSYSSGDILDANATQKLVDDKIAEVVGGATQALDTLKELGDAIPTKLSDLTNDVGYITESNGQLQVNQQNITVTTAMPFPTGEHGWPTNTTLIALCQAVMSDDNAKVGNIYLGGVSCSDLPTGMSNGELKIEIINALGGKMLVLTIVSSNLYPYHWERIYYGGSFAGMNNGEWRPIVPMQAFEAFVTAVGNEMNGTWSYDVSTNTYTLVPTQEEPPL